jgi:hypothetical protein
MRDEEVGPVVKKTSQEERRYFSHFVGVVS